MSRPKHSMSARRAVNSCNPCCAHQDVIEYLAVGGLVGKNLNHAGRSVDLYCRAGRDSSGRVGDAGSARDTEFAADQQLHRAPCKPHPRARCMTRLTLDSTARRVHFVAGPLLVIPLRAGQPDGAACRQRSAPPTERRTSARAGIHIHRCPAPAIRARPLRRRTGVAPQTAAAQVCKRCQLSDRTRHGCIIAHAYDNAPRLAWPAPSRGWCFSGPRSAGCGHRTAGLSDCADVVGL